MGKSESNHWITMDGPMKFNGSEAATRPIELVLLSLGGCAASDVASILEKKRVSFEEFRITLSSERADEHPKVFRSIHMEFVFKGSDIKEQDVARAIELSHTKYCPVAAMLKPSVEITTSYKIEES